MALDDFSMGTLFRGAFDYAETLGPEPFTTGFPNFLQREDGEATHYGIGLLGAGATWADVPESELGTLPEDEDVGARFRAAYDYAHERGHVAAVPNFHKFDYQDGRGMLHGLVLLDSSIAVWRDVPGSVLGELADDFADHDVGARFRAAHEYAKTRGGFVTAFPNFHNYDHGDGRGMVYGTILIRGAAKEDFVRDEVMRVFWRFRYELSERPDQQSLRLAHRTAFDDVVACADFRASALNALRRVYDRDVTHVKLEDAGDLVLEADTNGDEIRVHLAKWNDLNKPTRKCALIHMMMHLAGSTHPTGGDGYRASDPYAAELCAGGPRGLKCLGSGNTWRISDKVDNP